MIKREPDTLGGKDTATESVADGVIGTPTSPLTSFDGPLGVVGFGVGDGVDPAVGFGVG